MGFFKDDSALAKADLKPAKSYQPPLPSAGSITGSLAGTYNALGGLVETLAAKTTLDPVAVLAVWYVESGGRKFTSGKPIIEFENHKFFQFWGHDHAADFDQHYQFGGRAGVPGKAHKNHKFRSAASGAWATFHGDQAKEYVVFNFSGALANKEEACLSISIGGPQIMGFNHDVCGYASASEMFDAFAGDERWHVLGFFDFVSSKGLIEAIRDEDWREFGARYNGDGGTYGPKLAEAFSKEAELKKLPKA